MSGMGSFVPSEIVLFQGNLASEVKFPIRSYCSLTSIEVDVIEFSTRALKFQPTKSENVLLC